MIQYKKTKLCKKIEHHFSKIWLWLHFDDIFQLKTFLSFGDHQLTSHAKYVFCYRLSFQ